MLWLCSHILPSSPDNVQYLIIENIGVSWFKYKVGNDIGRFLPFEISDRIVPPPAFIGNFGKDAKAGYEKAVAAVPEHVIMTIILTAVIWIICYRVHKKRDL